MDLEKTTPDYYMEKYNKYIGVDVKTNSKKNKIYKQLSNNLKFSDENINTILLYLESICKKYNSYKQSQEFWLINLKPYEIIELFGIIGDPTKIKNERYRYMNHVLKIGVYDIWKQKNDRYFKLLNILED